MRQGGGYRRGAVAGLSLGEVFILLSFVLVLAVLLIDDETQREAQQRHLAPLDANAAPPPDPNKIQTLSEAESLRSELELAREHIRTLRQASVTTVERLAHAEAEMSKLSEELAAKEAELERLGERLREAETETASLADELSAEKSSRQLAEEKTAEITAQLQELNIAFLQAEENISALESRVHDEIERRSEAGADAALRLNESDGLASSLESPLANAQADRDRLAEELVATESELEQVTREKFDLAEQLSAEETIRQRAEEDIAELLRNLQELIAELQRNQERLAQTEETISNLEDDLRRETELRRQAEANAETERARADIEAAARAEAEESARGSVSKEEKGENPPCWYVRVEDGQSTREKAIYALDIRVTDNFMMFGDLGLPSGKPDRGEQGDFTSEATALGLPNLPYGEQLGDAEASRHLEKLFNAGEDMRVRSYPCTFFARVWDHTSTDSKARWQSIWEGVIGQYVQPYRVKEDPWPHASRP